MLSPQQIMSEIEALSDQDRMMVLDMIVDKYESPVESEVDPEVLEMLRARLEDLRSGKTKSIPADEVFAEIDALFKS